MHQVSIGLEHIDGLMQVAPRAGVDCLSSMNQDENWWLGNRMHLIGLLEIACPYCPR